MNKKVSKKNFLYNVLYQGRAKKVVQTAQKEQSEHLQRQNLLQKVRREIGLSLEK